MRLLFAVLLSLIFLSISCKDRNPNGILPQKQMTHLLTEVHLLDGYLQTLPMDSAQKVIDTLYTQLLAKYQLDSAGFERNVDFYYADPVLTEKMYTTIHESLQSADQHMMRTDSLRYARERDSLNWVASQQRLLDVQSGLMRFYPDSTFRFSHVYYKESLYRTSGLLYLWSYANVPMSENASSTRQSRDLQQEKERARPDSVVSETIN